MAREGAGDRSGGSRSPEGRAGCPLRQGRGKRASSSRRWARPLGGLPAHLRAAHSARRFRGFQKHPTCRRPETTDAQRREPSPLANLETPWILTVGREGPAKLRLAAWNVRPRQGVLVSSCKGGLSLRPAPPSPTSVLQVTAWTRKRLPSPCPLRPTCGSSRASTAPLSARLRAMGPLLSREHPQRPTQPPSRTPQRPGLPAREQRHRHRPPAAHLPLAAPDRLACPSPPTRTPDFTSSLPAHWDPRSCARGWGGKGQGASGLGAPAPQPHASARDSDHSLTSRAWRPPVIQSAEPALSDSQR